MQVDPMSIRAKLMLETTSHMTTESDWTHSAALVRLTNQEDDSAYVLFGANDPSSLHDVFERKVDISIMNPAAILAMAARGVGVFSKPMQVALIAVMPHYDQLAFAVSATSGLTSLDDIRKKRYPLRVSIRGSLDRCTGLLVETVLRAHGFDFADIVAWGGSVSYDQDMPNDGPSGGPSRVDRVGTGDLDAIFEEGVIIWVDRALAIGMRMLELDDAHLRELERSGFRRGALETSRFPGLERDVATVDFSGWPIYARVDTSGLLVRKFCEAMIARKASIPWNFGPIEQKPLPIERMVIESASTPIDVAFHPAAKAVWTAMGYLP